MIKKRLFNDEWAFTKQALGVTLEQIKDQKRAFQRVDIPHDWLIGQSENLYEDSMGWYLKYFQNPLTSEVGGCVKIQFEGIYMDAVIYMNGQKVGEWKNGYATFEMDITPFLCVGQNELLVSVNHQSPNSRWYSGAGIYRDVWLKVVPKTHILTDGIYITTKQQEKGWKIELETELISQEDMILKQSILEKETNRLVKSVECLVKIGDGTTSENQLIKQEIVVEEVKVWDIETPYLYILKTEMIKLGEVVDQEETQFGFRTIEFLPDKGFFLNYKNIKLKGVCEHHDLGCLGAAYHHQAMRRKFEILKKMGVNAIRTAHNMPAPGVLQLADEFGILINLESYDTWELSKTKYDYARFFKEWYKKDIASWVRRDRNHPSVIMWSIGNEIYDIHASEKGVELTQKLIDEVKKHDPKGNAVITMGSNYLPWENAQKSADIVKLVGYNYAEKYYEVHHEKYPDWIIYGSETASIVQSRGVYHFPFYKSVLADVDLQCSALGNSTTSWGAKSVETCLIAERDCKFSCGQFIWSGFDYLGEPTPYHTKNAYFGQIDTAGFPKDSYYIYQAEWTDYKKKPMIHIFPYWDFNEGQKIDIRVCSNTPWVELKKNGKSLGCFKLDHKEGENLVAHFETIYEKGEIEAIGYDENKKSIITEKKYSFGDAKSIRLSLDKPTIYSGGRDLAFLEINMLDEKGHVVENANNRVEVNVSGAGRLLGLDNGDSTDYESYKGLSRRLFNGKLLAVIGGCWQPGSIYIEVFSQGITSQKIVLESKETSDLIGCSCIEKNQATANLYPDKGIEQPIRKIELMCKGERILTEKNRQTEIEAKLLPQTCRQSALVWQVVDDAGIPSSIAEIKYKGTVATVFAKGDGSFRVRCMCKNGKEELGIISQLDFEAMGLGKAYLNPYAFIAGGLYTYSKGTVSNGNEHGAATARDGETQVGFSNIDFGKYGADEITLPLFALSDEPYEIQIWEGMPEETGSCKVADVMYQKPSIWNVYQEATYKLSKKLVGITSICFVTKKKIHIKGFYFKKLNVVSEKIPANVCDSIYGDRFKRTEEYVKDIGNNVTLEFEELDFTSTGINQLTLCGQTPIEKNTIHVKFSDDKGEKTQLLEIHHKEGEAEWTFPIEEMTGVQKVSFIFLPGSQFDFKWFCFKNH